MKTLIITSCTASKATKDPNKLTPKDFVTCESRKAAEAKISPTKARFAYDMYKGGFYGNSKKDFFKGGFESFLKHFGLGRDNDFVDIKILSAGYGLIDADTTVYPYNVSYNNFQDIVDETGCASKLEWGNLLNSRKTLDDAIREYDLILCFLSKNYLDAIGLPKNELKLGENTKIVFFNNKPVGKNTKFQHTFITDAGLKSKYNAGVPNGARCNDISLRGRVAYKFFQYLISEDCKNDPFAPAYANFDHLETLI